MIPIYKYLFLVFVGSAVITTECDTQQNILNDVILSDNVDSLSYIIGRDIGEQLNDLGANIKPGPFTLGIEHARHGKSSLIDSLSADSIRMVFAMEAQAYMHRKELEEAAANLEKSNKYFNRNKKRKGVNSTKSGLQYKVVVRGDGDNPMADDSVLVSYRAMFLDSTVFDSTEEEQPVRLGLPNTIPGLSEGIQLMQEGATYRFFIPPDLAFGAEGIPPLIAPNTPLIFDVELIHIVNHRKRT
ncbi:MAG: hypothetical protein GF401_09105 [Chitinivibrionales bacterium]|nr:hypothetical protein [Chitinivibrionales bacterium]